MTHDSLSSYLKPGKKSSINHQSVARISCQSSCLANHFKGFKERGGTQEEGAVQHGEAILPPSVQRLLDTSSAVSDRVLTCGFRETVTHTHGLEPATGVAGCQLEFYCSCGISWQHRSCFKNRRHLESKNYFQLFLSLLSLLICEMIHWMKKCLTTGSGSVSVKFGFDSWGWKDSDWSSLKKM